MATADAVDREPERSSWCHSLKVSSVLQKMTVKLIIHLIMVMPPWLLPLPCFPPCLSLLLQKHINQKSAPATQCTGGYPLTILTRLRFKFLLTFQFPDPQLGCQKITVRNSRTRKVNRARSWLLWGIFLFFPFQRSLDVMSAGN